tara:strand:+ start:303 stop:488 length:186 start_codon:yes stop_codon:yes gene_type:complete
MSCALVGVLLSPVVVNKYPLLSITIAPPVCQIAVNGLKSIRICSESKSIVEFKNSNLETLL